MRVRLVRITCQLGLVWLCLALTQAWALEPEEVLVVANKNAARSVGLAEYYMQQRSIPEENLLQLWVTDQEGCSRQEYQDKIAAPVRRALKQKPHIRALVLMYGMPLKAAGPGVTEKEKNTLQELQNRRDQLKESIQAAEGQDSQELEDELKKLQQEIRRQKNLHNRSSSVDSELALVKAGEYSLSMWIPNPYFLGFQEQKDLPVSKSEVVMVSRLDGPDSDTVKRIVQDSKQAEANGLQGRACFDARWKDPGQDKTSGYKFYDQSLHRAADKVRQHGQLEVQVDASQELFQPGDCPQTALYCGWYSLAKYVPAFEWQPGAVGFHIASQECQSLRRGEYWCKRMLEEGVAATLGPVGEPYVQSFPVPNMFFALLLEGYSLSETFLLSNPFWSWKMVLVGDPLYQPFAGSR
ncbi:MAG: TIGR03790 family protein [Desulfohalobiaceae bacterium]